MTRAKSKRLHATQHAIRSKPLHPSAVDGAYASFLRTGELPDDNRLAWAVLKRALNARKPPPTPEMESAEKLVQALAGKPRVQVRLASAAPPPRSNNYLSGPPREQVFKEAVHDSVPGRLAARRLIELLVQAGHDPTDPEFIPSDTEHPGFGGLAMWALGWPDAWVKPAFASQMERVMHQHAELRALGKRDEFWYREAAGALSGFLTRGELPEDSVLRQFALTVGEMFALNSHYIGHGGDELLAAYEDVAAATDPEREAALRRLGPLQVKATEARH